MIQPSYIYNGLKPVSGFPKWFSNQSLGVFFLSLVLCTIFFGHAMEFRYMVVAIVSTILFFFGGHVMYRTWGRVSEKQFLKNVLGVGVVIRLIWVAYCYFYFNEDFYGAKLGDTADCEWYVEFGQNIARWIQGGFRGSFEDLRLQNNSAVDDVGYPMWLALEYLIIGVENDVFIPMIIKCIVSAWCAKFIYNSAARHFDANVARVAALFVALNPNMIYWCGTMFKEPEMVFLCCWFIDTMDKSLWKSARLTFKALLPATLIGMSLFFFRSALGLVAFAAVLAHVVLASQRIISMGKKVIAGVLVAFVLLVGMGEGLRQRVADTIETVQSDTQQKNMEWRANRKDQSGRTNQFAKYAGAAVFAPLIFTIPFPTFNMANEGQILQLELSGGNFIKNVLSVFVILVLFMMLFSGEWRRHVFILAFTCGYLAALVFSNFAQSGRFHMPIIPMLMLFGAYGIEYVQQNRRWRRWWPMALFVEFVVCLGWNWFKLKGRGMI